MSNMNNKGNMINRNINIDISKLPEEIQNMIDELEEINKTDDWLSYDLKFDILDIRAKSYVLHNIITEDEYKKIIAKYGGIYD